MLHDYVIVRGVFKACTAFGVATGTNLRLVTPWVCAVNPMLVCRCAMAYNVICRATLAQLVEQLIRNEQVAGSNPAGGSIFYRLRVSYSG
jgi:hypothetical protein